MKKGYHERREGGILHGVLKKVALLILICFGIRFLSNLGAGEAFDGLLRKLGENDGLVRSVLSFELGNLPERDVSESPDEGTGEPEVPADENPVLFTYEPDQSDFYPAESNDSPIPAPTAQPQNTPFSPSMAMILAEYGPLPSPNPPGQGQQALNIDVLNKTSYVFDIESLLKEDISIPLKKDSPQILIIHTHSSEAYSGTVESRTLDKNFNVVKVGDVLTEEFEAMGFSVIHDREIYDYPSYSGSYSRSLESVESYIAQYPNIQIVIDLHRDSITEVDGSKRRTEYITTDGLSSAQAMLIIATGEAGLEHPNWTENFKLGLHLQKSMADGYPGFARPLLLSSERYNQHAAPGSFLLEIGTDGNTIDEAILAVRLFALSAEPVFRGLIREE
jgi:stage II sporulation protein P